MRFSAQGASWCWAAISAVIVSVSFVAPASAVVVRDLTGKAIPKWTDKCKACEIYRDGKWSCVTTAEGEKFKGPTKCPDGVKFMMLDYSK